MLDDRGGPKCEKLLITPGNNNFRLVGPWERYWRHWVKDTNGATHFIPCAGPRSNCKMCAFVRDNWESNPEVRQYKAGSSSLFNVIDRKDNWCGTNKHTKILCQWKSEIGVGPMIFDELKEIVNINKSWDKGDWDCIITKSGSGPTQTTYKGQATRDRIELTQEEKSYEKYDLKLLIPTLANPEEIDEIIADLKGDSATSEVNPPEALTMDDLKVQAPKVQEVVKVQEASSPKISKKLAPKVEPPKKKDNIQKCESDNCKGMLEFDNTDKEVTCPECKSTYDLSPTSNEQNPFENPN